MLKDYIDTLKAIHEKNEKSIKDGRHALACLFDNPYNIPDSIEQHFHDLESHNDELKAVIDNMMTEYILGKINHDV